MCDCAKFHPHVHEHDGLGSRIIEMPVLTTAEKRKLTRESLRILRPYIVKNRRKEHVLEAALLQQIKKEEAKKKEDEENRRQKAEAARKEKLEQLEEQLKSVREKRDALGEKLKSLQEGKHELFLKLKSALMAKEMERQEKQIKEVSDMQFQHPIYGQQDSHAPRFPIQQYSLERPGNFINEMAKDGHGYRNSELIYHQQMAQDSNWRWPSVLSQSQQQHQQGAAMRPTSLNPASQEQYTVNKAQALHHHMPFTYN